MSIFRTNTPAYRGQEEAAQPSRTVQEWFGSLFRVETPRYHTKPVSDPASEIEDCTDNSEPPVLSQSDPCD